MGSTRVRMADILPGRVCKRHRTVTAHISLRGTFPASPLRGCSTERGAFSGVQSRASLPRASVCPTEVMATSMLREPGQRGSEGEH